MEAFARLTPLEHHDADEVPGTSSAGRGTAPGNDPLAARDLESAAVPPSRRRPDDGGLRTAF